MKPASYGGVLLDFDGTLTKSFFDWPAMTNEMRFLSDDISILDYMAEAPEAEAARVFEILERHEREAARRAEVNEGARELLGFLRSRNTPFAVVTNNAMRHVAVMLDRMGLEIEAIITRDIGCWKPNPRLVLEGAKAIRVPPARCIVIGDGRYDMMAAREAGMMAVHLSGDSSEPCDYRVGRLADAIPLIERLIP
ncbi:MAG: HAD-IA family hydrolase [bacterium]|nr:HAD-IA family hydrolase [bacterium]